MRLKEVLRTNDLVLISFVRSLFEDAGIAHLVLDNHMSTVEGSLGVLPRRVLVGEDVLSVAHRVLKENGLAHEIRET